MNFSKAFSWMEIAIEISLKSKSNSNHYIPARYMVMDIDLKLRTICRAQQMGRGHLSGLFGPISETFDKIICSVPNSENSKNNQQYMFTFTCTYSVDNMRSYIHLYKQVMQLLWCLIGHDQGLRKCCCPISNMTAAFTLPTIIRHLPGGIY